MIEIEGFMPMSEAAKSLGVSKRTVAYYADQGRVFMHRIHDGERWIRLARSADVAALQSARQEQLASGRKRARLSLIGSGQASAIRQAERLEAIADQLINAGDALEAQAAQLRQAAWEGGR